MADVARRLPLIPETGFSGAGVSRWFDGLSKGLEAARLSEELMTLSDSALAERGLRREDISTHVFETVYGRR